MLVFIGGRAVILYYAMGGGLGHLARARAVAHTLGLRDRERVTLVTASPHARDPRVVAGFDVLHAPLDLAGNRVEFQGWLRAAFDQLRPSAIYVDTFPAGIIGELAGLPFPEGVPLYHLARLLRWPEYEGQLVGIPSVYPAYATSYLLEPLAEEHKAFLRERSREIRPLELEDPPAPAADVPEQLAELRRAGRPVWMILHSGPRSEIMELVAYAGELRAAEAAGGDDPQLVVIAPQQSTELPEGILQLDVYPARRLFPLADRLITACGFNVMREMIPYRDRHRFLPFERRFDDQFLRAARRRGEAGQTPPPQGAAS